MRSSVVLSILSAATVAILGCDSGTLTGPDAQRAYARAVDEGPAIPTGTLVLVDDQRVPAGQRLDLDPKHVARIEILKGAAAAELYGDDARLGVIRIYTTASAGPPR